MSENKDNETALKDSDIRELRRKVLQALRDLLKHDEIPPAFANTIYQNCGLELASFQLRINCMGENND